MGLEPSELSFTLMTSRECPHGVTESPRLQGILSDSCASPMCAKPSFTLVGARRSWKGFRSSAELANTSFPSYPDLTPCTQHRLPTFLSHACFYRSLQETVMVPLSAAPHPHPPHPQDWFQALSPGPSSAHRDQMNPACSPIYLHQHPPFSTSTCRETCGRREADLQELVNKSQVPTLAACHFK